MNSKAQSGVVGFAFHMLFFFLFISLCGGALWQIFGLSASVGGISGIEQFVLEHFSIIVILSAILGTIGYTTFGGGN